MRNETLRKKITANIEALTAKAQPILDELELQKGLLAQLDAHESKQVKAAEEKLGMGEASNG